MKTPAHRLLMRSASVAVLAASTAACGGDDDEPPTAWQGKTYELVIPQGAWLGPDPGIGREIAPFVPSFLLRVDQSAGTTHSATVATAEGGVQNMCNPTTKISGTGTYPNVTFGPGDVPLFIHNEVSASDPDDDVIVTTTIDAASFESILPNGSAAAEEGTFAGTLRARETSVLFTALTVRTADAFCSALVMSYDVPCEPCATDSEPFCLTLTAIGLGATETSATIETVTIEGRDASCADVIPE
jgi:hypothetical protein